MRPFSAAVAPSAQGLNSHSSVVAQLAPEKPAAQLQLYASAATAADEAVEAVEEAAAKEDESVQAAPLTHGTEPHSSMSTSQASPE